MIGNIMFTVHDFSAFPATRADALDFRLTQHLALSMPSPHTQLTGLL